MGVAVVDSGGANISSVLHALRRLGVEPVFTGEADAIRGADRVILPGVGSAGAAMERLRTSGLQELIPRLAQPVLGICLGMQLLFRHSDENDTPLLGIMDAHIVRLPAGGKLRVPHMGWNRIDIEREDPLLDGLDGAWFYFVHSYAAPPGDWTLATSLHGTRFSAAVRQGNFHGAQFHPERSAGAGARLLKNFLEGRWN
jgi:glutamine amidotransferase